MRGYEELDAKEAEIVWDIGWERARIAEADVPKKDFDEDFEEPPISPEDEDELYQLIQRLDVRGEKK